MAGISEKNVTVYIVGVMKIVTVLKIVKKWVLLCIVAKRKLGNNEIETHTLLYKSQMLFKVRMQKAGLLYSAVQSLFFVPEFWNQIK